MRQILLLAIFLLCGISIQAQHNHGVCGTTIADQELMDELFTNKPSKLMTYTREDQIYIPVKFHMVANTNGENRISFSNVLKNLARINRDYKPHNMTFYINDGVNEINSTSIFESPTQYFDLIVDNKDSGSLNIFICQNADTGSSTGTTLGYYSPQGDYIIVRKQEVEKANETLSHEIGHFFGLRHTFFGWEGDPWDEAKHGTTVTLTKAPGTNIDVEIVERTNCNQAADRFCDTPPDYNFGLGAGGCSFNTVVNDRNGDRIFPMTNNYMSYFLGCSSYVFSDEQASAARGNFNSTARDYLKSSYEADTTRLQKLVLTSPSLGATVDNYNAVAIEWEDYPEAGNTLLELTANGEKTTYISSSTNGIFLTDLEPNTSYQGFLVPFNDGLSDYNTTLVIFNTGDQVSDVNEIEYFDNINFVPNPVSQGSDVNISWTSSKKGAVQLSIFNLQGSLINTQKVDYFVGKNNTVLDTRSFQSGVYIVELKEGKNVLSKRIIID